MIDQHEITVSAHSMYITALVGLGVVGLVLLVAGYASILRGLRRAGNAATDKQWLATMATLVVCQLVFSVAYQVTIEQGVVVGLAILATRLARAGARREQFAS